MQYLIDYETAVLILVPILLIVYISQIVYAKIKNKLCKEFVVEKTLMCVFILYIIFVLVITLIPILVPPDEPESGLKIVNMSFGDIGKMWSYDKKTTIINLGGNIAMFIPFVVLGRMTDLKMFKSFVKCTALSFVTIMLIEGLQYFEMITGLAAVPRTVDIVDIICNTIGVIIGWIIFSLFRRYSGGYHARLKDISTNVFRVDLPDNKLYPNEKDADDYANYKYKE